MGLAALALVSYAQASGFGAKAAARILGYANNDVTLRVSYTPATGSPRVLTVHIYAPSIGAPGFDAAGRPVRFFATPYEKSPLLCVTMMTFGERNALRFNVFFRYGSGKLAQIPNEYVGSAPGEGARRLSGPFAFAHALKLEAYDERYEGLGTQGVEHTSVFRTTAPDGSALIISDMHDTGGRPNPPLDRKIWCRWSTGPHYAPCKSGDP